MYICIGYNERKLKKNYHEYFQKQFKNINSIPGKLNILYVKGAKLMRKNARNLFERNQIQT